MAHDLERLFRLEASELVAGLTQSLLALEKTPDRRDLIANCFRLAHTLKGAARTVMRTDISEMAHTMEETLAVYRENGEPIEPDCVSDLLKVLECIRLDLEKPAAHAERTGSGSQPLELATDRFATIRVELEDMDALLLALAEARAQLRGLHALHKHLARAQRAATTLLESPSLDGLARSSTDAERQRQRAALHELREGLTLAQRDAESGLGRSEQELAQAHALASALRLVPVSALAAQLELAIRDAAQLLGKQAVLELQGGEIRIEANVLSAVQDALLHMVRNAVDHGIEPPAQRRASGKDAQGRIRVTVQQRGRRVTFLCTDDGSGIDVAAVCRAAVARGVLTAKEAAALSPQEVLQLIFSAGVSTSQAITEMSGRGVGLDVVREIARRFHGETSATSAPGAGTTIGLTVPTSLASLTVLAVAVSGLTVLLPLDVVRGAVRVAHSELISLPTGDSIVYEGKTIAFVPLGPLLGRRGAAPDKWSVIILAVGGQLLALGAERIEGSMEVIVKPLPPAAGPHELIAGAALDAQGDPLLVLDPRRLLQHSGGSILSARNAAVRPPRPPILVIDDSLTTRTLEQSILEAAGYEVELAESAEEALHKARERSYGLFIVDIEMPGMNGFEFTAVTRADEKLRQVPIIVVSSLSSVEHSRRAISAGAAAYIVKSEFDQGRFIEKVAQLLHAP